MKIVITNPERLKAEREELIDEAMELIAQQERSCIRYCKKLCTIRNRILRISRKLEGD
jgi:hypothetical protein